MKHDMRIFNRTLSSLFVCLFLLCAATALGDVTLFNVDFSDETTETISTTNSSATFVAKTYDGYDMSMGVKSGKPINIVDDGLEFSENNYNNYTCLAIPLTLTKDNKVTATITLASAGKIKYNWASGSLPATPNAGSGTAYGTSSTTNTLEFTPTSAGNYVLYLGRNGSSDGKVIKSIVITQAIPASTWKLKGDFNSWGDTNPFYGSGTITATATLSANTEYEFKIVDGDTWYGNNGWIQRSISGWGFSTSENNCHIRTSCAGDYTFTFNTSTKELAVTYPNSYRAYFSKQGASWSKVYAYAYNNNDYKNADWPGVEITSQTEVICGLTYFYVETDGYSYVIFNNNEGAQTGDISTTGGEGKYVDGALASGWTSLPWCIEFDMKGHGDQVACQQAADGTVAVEPISPTVDGYRFAGWCTDASCTSTVDWSAAITENKTYYAKWVEVPTSVSISGTWLCFAGETLTLNATAEGGGTYSYQWYKGGTDESNKIDGATNTTYTKTCMLADAGTYYCKAWVVAGYEVWSSGYDVKVPYLAIQTGGGGDRLDVAFTRTNTSDETASCDIYRGVAWTYEYQVMDGFDARGNTGTMTHDNCTGWTMDQLNNNRWSRITTTKEGTYRFTMSFSNSVYTPIKISVTYPPMAQVAGYPVYIENTPAMQGRGWDNNSIYYRIGKGKYDKGNPENWTAAQLMTLVPGTDRYLVTTTPNWADDFWVWHIANNKGDQACNSSIYRTKSDDGFAVTESSNFSGDAIPAGGYTIYLNSTAGGYGADELNNNCQFYGYTRTAGMLTHTATIGATTHGSIRLNWTDINGDAQTATATTADLAHTCILTITAVPEDGYLIKNLKVNGVDFTSGDTYILDADATITAEFEKPCPAANSGEILYKFVVNSSVADGNICSAGNNPQNITTPTQLSTLFGGTLEGYITNNSSWNNLVFSNGGISHATSDKGVLILTLDCPMEEGDLIRFKSSSSSSSRYNYLRHTSYSTSTDQIQLDAIKTSSDPEIQQIVAPAAFDGKTELFIVVGARQTSISYFEIIRPCVITLDAGTNGGTVNSNATEELRGATNDNIALPHAFKNGFRFKGWFTSPTGGSPVSDQYTFTGSTTLYAQFEDCPESGTLYKFEVRTGLTNGSVTANNTSFDFNTANYLSTLIGGTLLTEGANASYIKIANTNSISIENGNAYLKVELDCELEDGDVIKSTIAGSTVAVTKTGTRSTTFTLQTGTLQQTNIPTALVGEKTLYIWRGSSNATISYFEITRPRRTVITLDATGAYNGYTHSVTATYEQAMPEITILPQRVGYVFEGYYDAPDGAGTQYYNGLGQGVTNWDKDVSTCTLYAHWEHPCNVDPTLTTIVPIATIWDNQDVDMSLVALSCAFDTTGISYSLVSASEVIPGCTFAYVDEHIYIQGIPAVGNALIEDHTVTFTLTNSCSPAHTYTVDAKIRIYPATQKARLAYIITGTKGGAFNQYNATDESSSAELLTYLRQFYTVNCVNGYATKDSAALAAYYDDYDLLIVTDYMETPEGYTNAIGTLIDKKPILSFEAYVAGSNGTNWHINSVPKDPSPKSGTMKVLCAGHTIFGDAEGVEVFNKPGGASDTTITVLNSISDKGLQGFVINEAPDFIFLATVRDEDHSRDLIVCCERQVVFQARMLMYCINFHEMGNLTAAGKVVMHQMIDYLLMTDETKVADCSLVFDNNDGDHLWSNPANWAPGYNITPTPFHPTRIIAECHVDTDNAHAGSVKVNRGHDAVGNPIDGKLIVKPYGGLTVAGLVATVKDTRYASPITIKAEDLLIESDETGNGAFVYGNKESDVRATVEYYSRGENANTTSPVWQYIGIPFQANKTAINMYYAAWMCRWTEASTDNIGGLWQWVNNEDVLIPFEGYCITQNAKKTYTFSGKLNPPITTGLNLDNRDADGYAFAANSWTAPIKIQEMADGDFVNAEKAIYIYHSGTYANWTTNGTPVSAKTGAAATLPGQYAVIPIHSSPYLAGADSVIPSMQGFFVKTDPAEDASLQLVYNRVVYDAKYFKTSTQPMRAPNRTNDPQVMRLIVSGELFGADQVYLLARNDFSDSFEDGWDGRKIEGDAEAPMLAVVKEAGEMTVAAVETANEHYLNFRAGRDSIYTFHFDYDGQTMYLYDLETNQVTPIITDNTYSFRATNENATHRFLITDNPNRTTTDIEQTYGEDNGPNAEGVRKILFHNQLYILRGETIYRADGRVANGKEVKL